MTDYFAPPSSKEVKERMVNRYKPAKVAKILSEQFAHKVSAGVIRKWDNYILSADKTKEGVRAKGEKRSYSLEDVEYFNLISVLRNMGYSLDEIKDEWPYIGEIGPQHPIAMDVMNRIVRQREAFFHVERLLTKLSGIDLSKIVPKNV